MNKTAQPLYCESCLDIPVHPKKNYEDSDVKIREIQHECLSCDYFTFALGE